MQKWKYLALTLGFISFYFSPANSQTPMWWSTYCPYPLDQICSCAEGSCGMLQSCAVTINNNNAGTQIYPLQQACVYLKCLEQSSNNEMPYGFCDTSAGSEKNNVNAHTYCNTVLNTLATYMSTSGVFEGYSAGSGANINYSALSSYMDMTLNIDIISIYTQCLINNGGTLSPGDPYYVAPVTQAPATSAPATSAPTPAPTSAPATSSPTAAPITTAPAASPIVCTLTNQTPTSPNPCSINTPSCSALCNLYSAANAAANHCVGTDALSSCRALWEAIAQYAKNSNSSPNAIVSYVTGGYYEHLGGFTLYEGNAVFNASDAQLYVCNGYCNVSKGGAFLPHPSRIPSWQKPSKIKPTPYTPWTKADEITFFQKARAQRLQFEAYIKAHMHRKHSSPTCSSASSHEKCIKLKKDYKQ